MKSSKKQKSEDADDGRDFAKSTLDPKVQDLVNFIFDKKLMEASMSRYNYDIKKLPLGELSNATVLAGYKVLTQIETVLSQKESGKIVASKASSELSNLSDQFYTLIPHNFGFAKMSNFVINSTEKLKEKLELITNLVDINTAFAKKSSGAAKKSDKKFKPNPTDTNYESLNCDIEPLDPACSEYKMLEQYLKNTSDGQKLKLLELYKVSRHGEAKNFNPKKLGNKKLLWHGSRFSNFAGILTNGMRIAPPEAPCTGYNFGKGVYFADLAGKSSSYSCSYLSGGKGLFVLCEVALGKPKQMHSSNCNIHLNIHKEGFDSCHAVGPRRPNPDQSQIFEKDIEVPMGKVEDFKEGKWWGPNEWIVYNTN